MKTSKQRLNEYRQEAATGKWTAPLTWRETRRHHPSIWATPNNQRGKRGEIFSDSIGQYGDDLGTLDKLYPRAFDHSGWYADNWQDALIQGHVCRMRCARGTLYIPATECTGWDGTVHYMRAAELVPNGATEDAHHQACSEAARSADHYAEKEAEEAREDDAKAQAEFHIEEARASIHELNREALALLREVKTQPAGFTPAVCEAVRDKIRDCLARRRAEFETIAARQDNYWTACPNG